MSRRRRPGRVSRRRDRARLTPRPHGGGGALLESHGHGAPPRSRPPGGLAALVATWFGAGRVPIAPGTAGTIATIPLYLLLARSSNLTYIAATLAVLVIGLVASDQAMTRAGVVDPGWIVIDESLGFLVTMTFMPPEPALIIAGFVLFRFFDMVKPLGIDRLESLPGGLGVMLDDFAAGVFANVILQVAALLHQAGA